MKLPSLGTAISALAVTGGFVLLASVGHDDGRSFRAATPASEIPDSGQPGQRLFRLPNTGQAWSLPAIHDRNVNQFISRPGMGQGRMKVVPGFLSPDKWLEVPREYSSSAPDNARTEDLVYSTAEFRKAVDSWKQAPGPELKGENAMPGGGPMWIQREFALVGRLNESGPKVYANGYGPTMHERHDVSVTLQRLQKQASLEDLRGAKLTHERYKYEVVGGSKNAKQAFPPEQPRIETAPAPARKLDDFESKALAQLRESNELVVRTSGTEMQLMGAIRAREKCLSCHECEVGTLLGAFTYRLTPAKESEWRTMSPR